MPWIGNHASKLLFALIRWCGSPAAKRIENDLAGLREALDPIRGKTFGETSRSTGIENGIDVSSYGFFFEYLALSRAPNGRKLPKVVDRIVRKLRNCRDTNPFTQRFVNQNLDSS